MISADDFIGNGTFHPTEIGRFHPTENGCFHPTLTTYRNKTEKGDKNMDGIPGIDYDPNVDYEALEQHTYDDSPGETFYTCPVCGGEYLASLIIEESGEAMCIDCANEN